MILILSLLLNFNFSHAEDKCPQTVNDNAEQILAKAEQAQEAQNLSLPQCKDLHFFREKFTLPENETKKINSTSKNEASFYKAYEDCQVALANSCQSNSAPVTESQLNDLLKKLNLRQGTLEMPKNGELNLEYIHMPDPGIHCQFRAQVLGEYLISHKIKAEYIEIHAPSIIGLVKNDLQKNTAFYEYSQFNTDKSKPLGNHWAIVIEVQNSEGKILKKVLDPQFKKEALDIQNYCTEMTGQSCEETSSQLCQKFDENQRYSHGKTQTSSYCLHNIGRFSIDQGITLESFVSGEKRILNSCGLQGVDFARKMISEFNALHDQQEFIQNTKLPAQMQEMKDSELIPFLRKQSLCYKSKKQNFAKDFKACN